MQIEAQPWRERYSTHRSPRLRFAAEHGRAPTFLEKIALCETLEELEGTLEGARDLYRMKLPHLIGDNVKPEEIKRAAALRRAEISKSEVMRKKVIAR